MSAESRFPYGQNNDASDGGAIHAPITINDALNWFSGVFSVAALLIAIFTWVENRELNAALIALRSEAALSRSEQITLIADSRNTMLGVFNNSQVEKRIHENQTSWGVNKLLNHVDSLDVKYQVMRETIDLTNCKRIESW